MNILDRTIDYLAAHPEAKFNWVESIFLHMWYSKQTDDRKRLAKKLIGETKQLVPVLGGWVMEDQAAPTYSASINQMTLGHGWLMSEFGVKPAEGWSLDPFGNSVTQAYLYWKTGFKYHYIARIPLDLRTHYINTDSTEFFWTEDNGVFPEKGLLTRVFETGSYYPPFGGFNFWNNDAETDPPITPSNVDARADVLIQNIKNFGKIFKSKEHLLIMWGGDFLYQNPSWVFANMTLVMDYINTHKKDSGLTVKWSDPKTYFDGVSSEGINFSTQKEDYFVYNDGEQSWWSGYFISQVLLKLKAREGEREMRIAEQVYSLLYLKNLEMEWSLFSSKEMDALRESLMLLRRKNAQLLHHDGITGTAKWKVSQAYVDELNEAIDRSHESMWEELSMIICPSWSVKWFRTSFLVESFEDYFMNAGDSAGFFVYNSLAWGGRSEILTFSFWTYETPDTMNVFNLKITNFDGTKTYRSIVEKFDAETYEVTVSFLVEDMVAAGYQMYILHFGGGGGGKGQNKRIKRRSDNKDKEDENEKVVTVPKNGPPDHITNGIYSIYFNTSNGYIYRIVNTLAGIDLPIRVDFGYYKSMVEYGQGSGPYIFSPASTTIYETTSSVKTLSVVDNSLFVEVKQQYSDYIILCIRLFKGLGGPTQGRFIEFEFEQLGTIPPDHEVLFRVSSRESILSNGTLYHDGLGLEMHRKDFLHKYDTATPPANMYPVQYAAYIQDKSIRMTMMTTKSQGVASMASGEMQMMIHRRTTANDGRGVGQPLQDIYVINSVRGGRNKRKVDENKDDLFKIRLVLEKLGSGVEPGLRHTLAHEMNHPLKMFALHHSFFGTSFPHDFVSSKSLLQTPLPKNNQIHLVSFDKIHHWEGEEDADLTDFVVRFNHLYQADEKGAMDPFPLNLFSTLPKFKDIDEMTLTLLDKVKEQNPVPGTINIKPIDIRTFKVTF